MKKLSIALAALAVLALIVSCAPATDNNPAPPAAPIYTYVTLDAPTLNWGGAPYHYADMLIDENSTKYQNHVLQFDAKASEAISITLKGINKLDTCQDLPVNVTTSWQTFTVDLIDDNAAPIADVIGVAWVWQSTTLMALDVRNVKFTDAPALVVVPNPVTKKPTIKGDGQATVTLKQ